MYRKSGQMMRPVTEIKKNPQALVESHTPRHKMDEHKLSIGLSVPNIQDDCWMA